MIELKGKYTNAKIMIDQVENGLLEQVYGIINSAASDGLKVVIQPDCHVGAGICVGFTMELGTMISPKICGVDIGCGMLSFRFSKNTKLNLKDIDNKIRQFIPMGFNIHENQIFKNIPFEDVQKIADIFTKKYNEKFNTNYEAPTYNEKWLDKKIKDINIEQNKFWNAIGTLGGGNHFIEIGVSNITDDYWVTIHSGSRNFGLKIADYWTNIATGKVKVASNEYNKEREEIIANTFPKSDIPKKLDEIKRKYDVGINKEYLQGQNMMGYLYDMIFAQQYSLWNRTIMMELISNAIGIKKIDEIIHTIHNYVDFNDFIIRKGAISSYEGQKMIIPFNMRDGILLCEGKSNSDWNYSAPHGSGRLLSRNEAKQKIDIIKFKESMKEVYSTSVNKDTIDESPFVYKDSNMIENLIQPTAKIIDRIKPILNIKDSSNSLSWKERKIKDKENKKLRKFERDLKYKIPF
jgi:tRNA-splicing ligase RtcB (3'-phosphate/5'-hydroxy nucleic acid ligase)